MMNENERLPDKEFLKAFELAKPIYPFFIMSGLYETTSKRSDFIPIPIYPKFQKEELRLDVDGYFPQMVASGRIMGFKHFIHWIADLKPNRTGWEGKIWYRDGMVTAFPYVTVEIQITNSWFLRQRTATVTFSEGGGRKLTRTYKYKSPYFHPANFEFDCATDEAATTSYNTCAHPNRPNDMTCEDLTIQTVYRRAGFKVSTTPGDIVPIADAGTDAEWSDQEMHDAMQAYWTLFDSRAQWAIWVFFASLHEYGNGLGGIMFDDIGTNHRQGTAIFNDSFISTVPAGDTNPAEWRERNLFFTAVHEMGHCFNLAHSFQKSLGAPYGTPWIPMVDEPEARSFMNYPISVLNGEQAFFADFEFRFSDIDLLFLRHAPSTFVQPGNADWFDDHGYQQYVDTTEPSFNLELRVNREDLDFEYMEPVVLELKLTNISGQTQMVDEHILSISETMTVIIKQEGRSARQFFPYARYSWKQEKKMLVHKESIYESLSISAGLNGWDIAQPGNYIVQVATRLNNSFVVSNPIKLRIAPARNYDENFISQDLFSDEVGRIFAFKGSQIFKKGNKTLIEITKKLQGRKIALHANYILGNEIMREYKQIVEDPRDKRKGLGIKIIPPQPQKAREFISVSLLDQPTQSIETFGHIDYKRNIDYYSTVLNKQGERKEAANIQSILYETMSKRQVHGRPIISKILENIEKRRDEYL